MLRLRWILGVCALLGSSAAFGNNLVPTIVPKRRTRWCVARPTTYEQRVFDFAALSPSTMLYL